MKPSFSFFLVKKFCQQAVKATADRIALKLQNNQIQIVSREFNLTFQKVTKKFI